jgi:hypothetical protein
MTLTLVLVVFALTAVLVVATRVEETVKPIVASEATEADTLAARHAATPAPPAGAEWQLHTVKSLADAEAFLDCLERQGVQERELVILGEASFAVRWR